MPRTAQEPAPSSWIPVPRSHVHKHNADEAMLTAWRQTGPDTFLIRALWPGSHSFYSTGTDGTDPLLFGETVRQCLPMLSHAAYEVPLGHHLLWETYDYSLTNGRPADHTRSGPHTMPREITLYVRCTDVTRRGARAAAATVHIRALHGDSLIGTATTRFTVQSPAVYRRLRAEYADTAHALERRLLPPAPLPAREAGRGRTHDVVLAPTTVPGRHQLRVDTGHPVLFDHPVDHVPGILLLDAARQAAHAASAARPCHAIGMTTRFFRYVEFDAPCWVETAADPAAPTRLRVTARQYGRECFTASVALTTVPRANVRFEMCGVG
ncbi:ScbA/BarX family gamma-butyrolactone biosynthesis protein [Streptomyces murinus]|uniref:ScbA/BarX family gamma-butyrolactone biosynthesis protein n=1 Tax=Streptomyces murinus TaxID=33900 RepID=UPI0021142F6A|nr:ScbA/BarX family gamma-butyrolactone biosynthesis protein [Streptomyces murinus]